MPWSALATVVGGAVVNGMNKKGEPATSTQTRDPWSGAQPYMLGNLKRGQDLQNFYERTPFNPQQIEGYSNLFSDTNNFRNNTMPGLMDFANKGMTSSYSRQTGGAPGSGGGYGGAVHPGGLLQSGVGAFAAPVRNTGQVGQPSGLLDLNGAQNPFSAANRPAAAPAAADPLAGIDPETLTYIRQMMAAKKLQEQQNFMGGGMGPGDAGNGGNDGSGGAFGGGGMGE